MEDIYRFEFTSEELTRLVSAILREKISNEQFIKAFPDDPETTEICLRNILQCDVLLNKLRRDYK